MPSKIRKAIGAVKDSTSIGLAKVTSNSASNLQVAILRATNHDEVPMDERYVEEVLRLITSRKSFAAACAQIIGKRIGKTRNWIVALKSLMLVLRIFQDGDPHFPREVLHAMKHGTKILNLSSFRDDSNSSPWDYTAFVRTFALYLDERLDCFLTGKLQRRWETKPHRRKKAIGHICDMKPTMLLDKISFWQRLLDRALGTRPTGAAKNNKLVQISLYAIVQESFDLYRDISDGLALLLDSFFHLQYHSCVTAFQNCVKATNQFEELSSFYEMCKSIGVGRTSEYPSVQKISEELLETLQEFLKDQASFPITGRTSPTHLLLSKDPCSSSEKPESYPQSEISEQATERESEFGSQCTSLEDLMSRTDGGTSPAISPGNYSDCFDNQSLTEDFSSTNDDSESSRSLPVDQRTNSTSDLVSFDDCSSLEQKQEHSGNGFEPQSREGWEIMLSGSANVPNGSNHSTQPSNEELANGFGQSSSLFSSNDREFKFSHNVNQSTQDSQMSSRGLETSYSNSWEIVLAETAIQPIQTSQNFANSDHQTSMESHNNPFLQDPSEFTAILHFSTTAATNHEAVFPASDIFGTPQQPTFQAITPTFCAYNSNEITTFGNQSDPFVAFPIAKDETEKDVADHLSVLKEQELWFQHQNKIISKNMS